jgi:putative transposase
VVPNLSKYFHCSGMLGLAGGMRKKRQLTVGLKAGDRKQIAAVLRRGKESVRVIKRAQTLRLLHAGESPPRVGAVVGLSAESVRRIGWRYCQQGLQPALYEKPRPGGPRKFTTRNKQQIIAMVCGPPPVGQARWTVRLIAEEAVKRKLVKTTGRESVRLLLQRHDLKPWREKNVVCGGDERGV